MAMFGPIHKHVPAPPGAGLTKVADPRRTLLGWLVFVGLVAAIVAGGWQFGVGDGLRRMRREFVAIGYLQAAQADAGAVPARRAQALTALNRAVQLAPDHPLVTEAAAQLYVELRAYREALQWLPRDSSDGLLSRVTLAQSLIMTGQAAAGDVILARAQGEVQAGHRQGTVPDPLFALVLNNIAYVQAVAGRDLPQALQMATVAVQLEPAQPAYIDSLGWVKFQLGDYLDAAFDLERAVRLHLPAESAEMYYHLGTACARLGRRDEARWNLRRALELDPSYVEASDELRRLSQDLPRPNVAQKLFSCGAT